ncbi:MAG: hypothetical protein ILNGONEN_01539 [Syntrophorhabdaceae bacterium]|nr:hypothetical protein [Syntrophorhabdaceae bacterium]
MPRLQSEEVARLFFQFNAADFQFAKTVQRPIHQAFVRRFDVEQIDEIIADLQQRARQLRARIGRLRAAGSHLKIWQRAKKFSITIRPRLAALIEHHGVVRDGLAIPQLQIGVEIHFIQRVDDPIFAEGVVTHLQAVRMAVLAAHDAVIQIQVTPLITFSIAKNGKTVALEIETVLGINVHLHFRQLRREIEHGNRRALSAEAGFFGDNLGAAFHTRCIQQREIFGIFINRVADLIKSRVLQNVAAATVFDARKFEVRFDQLERHVEHFFHRAAGDFFVV